MTDDERKEAVEFWTEVGQAVDPVVKRWSALFGEAKRKGGDQALFDAGQRVAAEAGVMLSCAAQACSAAGMPDRIFDEILDNADAQVALEVTNDGSAGIVVEELPRVPPGKPS